MSVQLSNFEPKALWLHFDALRQIPRPSKQEKAASDYVMSVAKKHGFTCDRDDLFSVVVRVPATPGHEDAATVVLQSHLDMVCEKNADVDFNFATDPIQLRTEGEWLYAQGTTLGADNGIGVAAALAVLDDPGIVHGPLELLFTVDEETGLTGAGKIRPDFIAGRTLINLDSEEEGHFSIGCAGGADSKIRMAVELQPAQEDQLLVVTVSGLKGGHSGMDIHKNRGNAIKFLGRILLEASAAVPFRLADISGGNMHNAIPREATARVAVAAEQREALQASLESSFADLGLEYEHIETGRRLVFSQARNNGGAAVTPASQDKLLNLLAVLPHGILKMSADIPGLVESSVNLATIRLEKDQLDILMSARSAIGPALRWIGRRLKAIGSLTGASVAVSEGYPGWSPNLDSQVLKVADKSYEALFGKKPVIEAVHGGLECGIIGEKYPGMDMVSIGPQIEHPHSPDERVNIPSVARFWQHLSLMLKELA